MDVSLTRSEGMTAGALRQRFDDINGQTAKKVFGHMTALKELHPDVTDGLGDGNHLFSGRPVQSSARIIYNRFLSPQTRAYLGIK